MNADRGAEQRPERLFLGVALPAELREALRRWLGGVALPGRPVPPENWHLTMRFLGATEAERRAALERALSGLALGEPFSVRFGELGAFPRAARAAVLWVGVRNGEEALRVLAAQLEAAAREAGFAAEDRPFRPHLTLSRIQPPRDVRSLLAARAPAELSLRVTRVTLFRSQLGRGPARYEPLAEYPL